MTRILVTGGTGVLGRAVVRRLTGRSEVRVLSRRGIPVEGAEVVRGNLDGEEGLAAALDGVDVIVHCATSADYLHPEREADQTRRLIAAADGTPHLVYISIVGVDRVPFSYYRAKLATERLIENSGLPWSVLRATQFHEFVLLFLIMLSKGPIALAPRDFPDQPVETGEVADQLAELALGDPGGRVPDLGGPRVERFDDLMRAFLAATGRRKPVLTFPIPGKVGRGFRAGGHLLDETGVTGTRTFADFLDEQVAKDGSVKPAYSIRRRAGKG
jgi:uncharacterized protein YbjT (DUF2867 family)